MLSDDERRNVQELDSALMSDRVFARAVLPITRRIDRLSAPVVVGVTADGSSDVVFEWASTS